MQHTWKLIWTYRRFQVFLQMIVQIHLPQPAFPRYTPIKNTLNQHLKTKLRNQKKYNYPFIKAVKIHTKKGMVYKIVLIHYFYMDCQCTSIAGEATIFT